MGIKQLKIRKEVLEGKDDPAPKLGKILEALDDPLKAEDITTRILSDPREFFKRTYFTKGLLSLFESVINGLESGKTRVFLLYSFYGGGKTHSLLAILHAFRNPDLLRDPEIVSGLDAETRAKLEEFSAKIKSLNINKIISFAGENSRYSGNPLSPTKANGYSYRTMWGYLAHKFGKYDLLRDFDEKLVAPQQDIIEKLLKGEESLIIIDELSDYIKNFSGSEYREYAQTVVNFMELFLQAVRRSKSVVIISLPVERTESGEEVTDWRYQDDRIIRSLWDTVKGVGAPISPLSTGKGQTEIVEVLKKRIFEEIPEHVKMNAIQRLREKYVNYQDYFGSDAFLEEIEKTYPFSPEYINTLEELIFNTKLQKTRDALWISMNVIRDIVLDDSDPEYITIWHINLAKQELQQRAFLNLSEYIQVYYRQVDGYEGDYETLAKLILRTIFVKTYHYDSGVKREEFPTRVDIVRMVFEPEIFSKNNWEVPDIYSAIDAIRASPYITHLNEDDGRFWFWKFPNVKEYIRKKADRLVEERDPRIVQRIAEYVEISLEGKLEKVKNGTSKKRKKDDKVKRHTFREIYVIRDYGSLDIVGDNRDLKLVVIVPDYLSDEINRLFEESEEGKPRTYRNTLAVVTPDRFNYDNLYRKAAELEAADLVKKELSDYFRDYGEDVVKTQAAIVENIRRGYEIELVGLIPQTYSIVHYPASSGIANTKVTNPSYNIAEGAYETLLQEGKIVESLDFDYFISLIESIVGVDITNNAQMRTASQIIEWFKQNPNFPMVDDELIKDALKEGVRRKRIGIVRENKVFFKRVHDVMPISLEDEGEPPSEIKDNDGILSQIRAVEEQFRRLKEEEKTRHYHDHIEKIYYVILTELGGKEYTLSQLEMMADWKDIFLMGLILKKVVKVKYSLDVEIYPHRSQKAKPGEEVVFIIKAIPLNLEVVKINYRLIKDGSIVYEESLREKREGSGVYYKAEITLTAPDVAGMSERYKLEVLAKVIADNKEEELAEEEFIEITAIGGVEVIKTPELRQEHIGTSLIRIEEIEDYGVLEDIKNMGIREIADGIADGALITEYGNGSMELNIRNILAEVAIEAALDIAEYGSETKINRKFRIEPKELTIDEVKFKKLSKLNKRAMFILRTGGE